MNFKYFASTGRKMFHPVCKLCFLWFWILYPGLTFSSQPLQVPLFEFGEVQSGEIVYVTGEVVNTGSNDVVIESIETSCPCFTVLKKEQICPANKRIDVPIRVDTAGHVGETTQTMILMTNCGAYKTTIHGKALADVQSAPSRMIFFDPENKKKSEKVYIWSEQETFQITGIDYDEEVFDIAVDSEIPAFLAPKKDDHLTSYVLKIRLNEALTSKERKNIERNVVIHSDSNKRSFICVETKVHIRESPILTCIPPSWINNRKKKDNDFLIVLHDEKVKIIEINCSISGLVLDYHHDSEKPNHVHVKSRLANMNDSTSRKVDSGKVTIKTNLNTIQVPILVIQ
jgi:hypothetical protein